MRHSVTSLFVAATAAWSIGPAAAPAPAEVGPAAAEAAASCDLPLGDADADESAGALVMLLDGTLSSESQAGRVEDLLGVLDLATTDRHLTVSIGSFGGTDAEVRFDRCLDGVAFVARGNNDRTRERNREPLLAGAGEQLAALQNGYDTSDPTAALRAGVARLDDTTSATSGTAGGDGQTAAGNEQTRLLVIHTDGIPTAGCAALGSQVDVSDPDLVERLVSACVDAGALPDATGTEIVIGGVARTDTDLGDDAVDFLIELNTALCTATGATCHVAPNFPSAL